MQPLVVIAGTVAVSRYGETVTKLAATPLKVTGVTSLRFVPWILTAVPVVP
jgi:hypothetical protein